MASASSSIHAENAIRRRVVTGEIVPGAWLRESALARELGVSRTPVREACNRLASDGLIDWEPMRGFRSPALDPDELEAVYPVLVSLETLAVASIGEPLAALAAGLEASELSLVSRCEEVHEYYEVDRSWHRHLVAAAENPVLLEMHTRLAERLSRYMYTYWRRRTDVDRSEFEHGQIAEAFQRDDRQLASALLRSHRLSGLKRIRKFVTDNHST
jgi:DNA-binding GntR family transcriptional regulator